MQDKQVHALRACSLVAMPPPEQRTPPPGGFPKDLATLNLTGWAGLIQDVAQGMRMVPSNLSMEVYTDSMVLLQLLEATTGMWYCRICSQLTPSCLCSGAYTSVPTETWSQTMASVPAQGVAASSSGSTTSEASTVEAQELGLTSPPRHSHPSISPVGAYLPGGSTDWGITLTIWRRCQRTSCRPMGTGSMGPDAERSSGNAPHLPAKAAPTCCPISVTSAANEPTSGSVSAGSTAAKPAHYPVPAGHAATEASGERRCNSVCI